MNEATCKAALVRRLRELVVPAGGIVYRHEDTFTGGIPDVSVSAGGFTVWAEVKLDRPGRRSELRPLQRLALEALYGLEIHYAIDKERVLSCKVTDYRTGEVLCHLRSGNKTVHHAVADTILKRFPPLTVGGPFRKEKP